jgi:proteic killer suppression protein
VIRSFKGDFARMILDERRIPKGFPTSFAKIARRKLIQLNNADDLGDLAVTPGNRFEALKGNLAGRYSIRINDQWRIVFRWTSVGPEEVEIRDYH